MYEQAVLPIRDEKTFSDVHGALKSAFAAKQVERFLNGVQRNKLRARQFEAILASGLLGPEAAAKYAALGDSDRGHIREQYLSMVEHVEPAIRAKYLKVYAYY
ncbi:hypothetical protein HNQ77_003777 [Silvibacterium bohemicum]|uniref:Uncharacterized protein n=1 Tax=Silvibacterium bohemicum TaxID=1577686 RepID=A0A841JWU5_9BACT|nr:hypothetical protein [Silvibacterium bohemicum]MBB6145816.1 hypothetical protein [Silvibacterium bohemicum]